MKIKLTSSVLALALLFGAAAVSASRSARSDEGGWYRDRDAYRFEDYRRRHQERGFWMGVCVGQNLSQQGVTLPAPQPGARPSPDPTTEAAVKAAVQQCRAEFSGTSASPTPVPSAAPSTTPTSNPTPVDNSTPTPTSSSSSS